MKNAQLPNCIGGYGIESKFFNMETKEFRDYCGGMLATALFKGELSSTLFTVISMAEARGQKFQMEVEIEKQKIKRCLKNL